MSDYWADRFEHLQERLLKKGDTFYKDLVIAYELGLIRIEKDIAKFYMEFSKNNKISYADAKRKLTTNERKRFKMELDEYIEKGRTLKYSNKWDKKLQNASTLHHITRLESLYLQVTQEIETIYSTYNMGVRELAKDIVEDGYYRGIYEIQKGRGRFSPAPKISNTRVEYIVAKPWTKDNRTFSSRIWKDKDKLIDTLESSMKSSFIRGDPPGKLIKEIMEKFNVNKYSASRLVHTESAYFSSVATLESYKATELKKYKISATLDLKTSKTCQDLDGEIKLVEYYKPGITAPPFHPFCRTTTVPYTGLGVGGGERFARGKDGKSYYVEGGITYHQWRAKYVDNKEEK